MVFIYCHWGHLKIRQNKIQLPFKEDETKMFLSYTIDESS